MRDGPPLPFKARFLVALLLNGSGNVKTFDASISSHLGKLPVSREYASAQKNRQPCNVHVFGDMHIAGLAIFLGASILTRDRKLTQMAGYAGVKCFHVPRTVQ